MIQTEELNYGDVSVFLLVYDAFVIEEQLHHLLPSEIERLETINHPSRKREFVATRVLRSLHFGAVPILYTEIGAPYIDEKGFISISHADCVVGLAYCRNFQVGLDLEPIREKVMRVKHKFLSEDEKLNMDTSSVEEMIKVWSGKEALYKLAGRKKIIFSDSLLLTKRDESNWLGRIVFDYSKKAVELRIDKKDNFVISINTSPIYEIE